MSPLKNFTINALGMALLFGYIVLGSSKGWLTPLGAFFAFIGFGILFVVFNFIRWRNH